MIRRALRNVNVAIGRSRGVHTAHHRREGQPTWQGGRRRERATLIVVSHPFLDALRPVADALGAQIVPAEGADAADIPLAWEGRIVAALRLPQLQGALSRLIDNVEREFGGRLHELSRDDKQRAVKVLDDQGAFVLRRSVEDVADAFGVSRITIYNYLNAIRDPKP